MSDPSKLTLYPLRFEPVFKDYIWGGRNLQQILGRDIPDGVVAESWEIAAHPDGTSVVANGPYAGLSLTELHSLLGLDLIGTNSAWAQARHKFPLLIKLLDANDKLSVQVHPDDDYALAHEGNELGKTEMWVVLHAEPGAAIELGVRAGTTRDSFAAAIADDTLEQFLHIIPIKKGDCICVPSGSLHALLNGAVIAEIQQNSNTTYRVFDWNRTQNGRPRQLHIQQSLDVINFDQVEPQLSTPQLLAAADDVRRSLLCHNRYFATERVEMTAGSTFDGDCDGRTLEIWGLIEGHGAVAGIDLSAVEFVLLPAAMGAFRISAAGDATWLRIYVPDPV